MNNTNFAMKSLKSRPQKLTPIASDMFIPNMSGENQGRVGERFCFLAGSAVAPSFHFCEDPETGIFQTGAGNNTLAISNAGVQTALFGALGSLKLTPQSAASGTYSYKFWFVDTADIQRTAGVLVPGAYWDFSATQTWATGDFTTQYTFGILAQTIAFSGASTITNAVTFYIDGAPTAGTNATFTNKYALWIDNNNARFDGWIENREINVDPTTAQMPSLGGFAMYQKNRTLVFAYNNAGTMTYLKILLDGSTITWVHDTNAP